MSLRATQLTLLALLSSALAVPVGVSASSSVDCVQPSGRFYRNHHGCRPTKSLTVDTLGTDAAPMSFSTTTYSTTTTALVTVTMDDSDAASPASSPSEPTISSDPTSTVTSTPVASTSSEEPSSSGGLELDAKRYRPNPAVSATFSSPVTSATTSPLASSTTTRAAVATSSVATSSTAPTTSTAVSNSGAKRGLAFEYNGLSNLTPFQGNSKVAWAYNWQAYPDSAATGSKTPSGIDYVPMLWGITSDKTSSWDNAAAKAISNGATAILGFNEPDHSQQANIPDVGVAASNYQSLITAKYSGKVRLGSPAVTNGAAPMGLDYLTRFMSQCGSCNIDFVVIHWYDSATNIQYFKDHVTQAHTSTGKPVWLTEFGATGSDADVASFLAAVLPWLDQQSFVERYAYFMVDTAAGHLLSSSSTLSTIGRAYVS